MVHQCEDERDPRVERLHLLPMREAEQCRVCRGASTDWLALWEVLPKQHLMPLCAVYEKGRVLPADPVVSLHLGEACVAHNKGHLTLDGFCMRDLF